MDIKSAELETGEVVVTPSGDVDMSSSVELRNVLQKLVKSKTKTIIVSLQEVDYIDSSGLATLIECMKKSAKYGGALKLVIDKDKILNVFKLAKLDMIFKIHKDIASATT